jgi:hypothetical protein
MKATRIFLFMSPLLVFVPAVIPVHDSVGIALVNYFYRGVLGAFPGNVLMAFLCYTYAGHLGREEWLWVLGSMRFPYLVPFILAFMPAKYGSAADQEQSRNAKQAPAKALAGAFETRFPLLSAYLSSKTPAVVAHARARMEPVPANFEFSAFVDKEGLNALVAAAEPKRFTLWMQPEEPGMRVFGAAMLDPGAMASFTKWLQEVAPQRKLATAVHPNEGPTKYFEYYPGAA